MSSRKQIIVDRGFGMPLVKIAKKPQAGGRGIRLKRGEMNRLEEAYARHLEGQRLLGLVAWYGFHVVKFRLADNTYYEPDFMVMLANGEIEIHETKGHWEDKARVKIKIAASMFPFRFKAVQRNPKADGGGWKVEVF